MKSCDNCGENIDDVLYECAGCYNVICEFCANTCKYCKGFFCDACYVEHKKNCAKKSKKKKATIKKRR
ncbi:MAG: hypothetical protein JW891_06730 [Candidatus Lokiarchaeota archaeon]|nr:hypothetical protein [Candidatus Lokiarchaeota archaeon]